LRQNIEKIASESGATKQYRKHGYGNITASLFCKAQNKLYKVCYLAGSKLYCKYNKCC